jgi:hypothetical protein
MKKLTLSTLLVAQSLLAAPLVYEGDSGPGQGSHIVFIAADQEYRSEETLPAIARILAKHHGFKCTVLFSLDTDGTIHPGKNHIPGMEALNDADLMVNFMRFRNLPDAQMQAFEDYLLRGGSVFGLRTASHAFMVKEPESPWARYHFMTKLSGYARGFGRHVLGDGWSGHHGRNHVMSTRIDIAPAFESHPIMRGVETPWAVEGGYWQTPAGNCQVMAHAQPLVGMEETSADAPDFKPAPAFWTRDYRWGKGQPGKAAYLAYGASESLMDECFRRLVINTCFALSGHEADIRADLNIDFVGDYKPSTFQGGKHLRGVTPAMLQGWDAPIPTGAKPSPGVSQPQI